MATERLRTIKPSGQGGDYTSLSAWEAGEQADLVALDEIRIGEIQGDWSGGPDNSPLTVLGWTTDPTRYVEIRADSANAATGEWNSTKYYLYNTTSDLIFARAEYMRIRGLQLFSDYNAETFDYGISTGTETVDLTIDRCFIRATLVNDCNGCIGIRCANGTTKVSNCVIIGYTASGTFGYAVLGGIGIFYNCTAYDCLIGFRRTTGTATAKNSLAQNCPDGFNGTFNGTHNCSDISSDAPGSNPVTGTVIFVNAAGFNFHLAASDTVAKDAGTDLSADPTYPFSTDIDGETRSGTWDIGADEYIAASGSGIIVHGVLVSKTHETNISGFNN